MTRIPIPNLSAGQAAHDSAMPCENPAWKLCEAIDDIAADAFRQASKTPKGQHRVIRDVELIAEPLIAGEVVMPWTIALNPTSAEEDPTEALLDAIDQLRTYLAEVAEKVRGAR